MKNIKNKTKIFIMTLVLTLTFAATFTVLTTAFAEEFPTYAFLNIAPNPIGLNQQTVVSFWVDKMPPMVQGSWYDAWHNYTVKVTKPDGTISTLGPFTSDPVGNWWTFYTPDQIGDYTFQFIFPGEWANTTTFSRYYKPSTSAEVTLTVQDDPVLERPETPLPEEYWSRPIDANNREWSSISGDWLMTFYDSAGNKFNPYSTAPNSAHILWTRPMTFGGIAGGSFGSEPYYTGLSYEFKFTPPIILNGRLYYNNRVGSSWRGFTCVDLRTGEEVWFMNTSSTPNDGFVGGMITNGQVYKYETPNQYGVQAYLWSMRGTLALRQAAIDYEMFDAFSGQHILTITNVSRGGTPTFSEDGSILVYLLDGRNSWLALWNSSKCIGSAGETGTAGWQWRPGERESVLDWKRGIEWNVTVPTYQDPMPQSIATNNGLLPILDIDSGIILAFTGFFNLPSATSWMEIGYDAKSGDQVWAVNRTFPTQPTSWGIMGVVGEGVYCEFIPNTMEWYGYDIKTGEQLWGPTEPYSRAFGMYVAPWGSSIAYGKLFTGNFDGIVHAFDVKTGKTLWEFDTPSAGFETAYGNTPVMGTSVADGKVFVSTGHTHLKPLFRDTRLYALDESTGEEIWSILNFHTGMPTIIADGCLVTANAYDNRIYCFGKGVTETTVAAEPKIIAKGNSVMIEGTVTDQSPGNTNRGIPAAGTPAIADEYMTEWMEYLYMQQPCPAYYEGVDVKLEVLDPNGNFYEIDTVKSDGSGMFKKMWTPDVEGEYTIIATFEGSESYWRSYAETVIGVTEAPAPSGPIEPEPTEPTEAPLITTELAIIIAVIVVAVIGVAAYWVLRKRK
jgi:outer membrane protein assembly factor BamB